MSAFLKRLAQAGAAIAAGVLVGAAAVWAHGGDTAMVHGCVGGSGALRIVGASEACAGGETALDWASTGVPGPGGPTGPLGPKGATGTAGPSGPAGDDGGPAVFALRKSIETSNGEQTVSVSCPAGKSALGGGWETSWGAETHVMRNEALKGAKGWFVQARSYSYGAPWKLTVTVTCVGPRVLLPSP